MTTTALATRPASEADVDFMYVAFSDAVRAVVEPQLGPGEWSETGLKASFSRRIAANVAHILELDGQAIGWLAGDESGDDVMFDEF